MYAVRGQNVMTRFLNLIKIGKYMSVKNMTRLFSFYFLLLRLSAAVCAYCYFFDRFENTKETEYRKDRSKCPRRGSMLL